MNHTVTYVCRLSNHEINSKCTLFFVITGLKYSTPAFKPYSASEVTTLWRYTNLFIIIIIIIIVP